jgi:hypothetical protein
MNLIDDLPSLDEQVSRGLASVGINHNSQVYRNLLQLKRDYLHGDDDLQQLGLAFEVSFVFHASH